MLDKDKFHMMLNRPDILNRIRHNPEISVLVIGGGINGIATFRELALQGIDVLLVEKSDFCAGASAGSSHMLHGGIRYLENGEFRLVREALHERNLMIENAPHYAKPLPTTIPIFKWASGLLNAPLKFVRLSSKPAERGALVIKLGLMMYDFFVRKHQIMPRHQVNLKAKALEKFPHLNPEIVCTATYYDGFMAYPERLCLELLLDAEAANEKAVALNYVSAVHGAGEAVTLKDEVSGEQFEVKPALVVNAAGPWIDFANRAMQQETRFIGGTKGSHLVVDHPELLKAAAGNEIFFENNDGRIVLILPFLDRVMLGTTDIPIDDPDQAECTEDEVDYILHLVKKVFPTIHVDRSHIVFKFTGVRPLPASDAATPGQISRDHSIRVTEAGNGVNYPIFSLVGGKWTTQRAFGEQVADQLLQRLGLSRKVDTKHRAFGGGKNYPKSDVEQRRWIQQLQEKAGISAERAQTLFDRYGTYAEAIAAFCTAERDYPLENMPDFSQREIIFLARNEKVVHVTDILLRRTLLGMLGKLNRKLVQEIATVMVEEMGWTPLDVQREVALAVETVRVKHNMELV